MLRISLGIDRDRQVLKLEGRLAEVWVGEAEARWASAQAGAGMHPLVIDLRDVLGVDAAGRALLARMFREGGEFVVSGCAMRALVAEVADAESGVKRPFVERT